jgi:succinate-acetate transporter protein
MGKILSLAIGAVVAIVGFILLAMWWKEFLFLLRVIIPVVLIFGGVISIIAGISEFKDTAKAEETKKEE